MEVGRDGMKPFFYLTLCVHLLLLLPAAAQEPHRRVEGVYRLHAETSNGYDVWIVDGAAVRREIYPEFLYGGNGQRYLFIPTHEIWIDNTVAAEEYSYTVAHELCERALMARKGRTYDDAHDSALVVERRMRISDDSAARGHEASLSPVSPTDCDGVKEIHSLADSIRLHSVYRAPLGKRGEISVWIVDGATVRRGIYPDFGLSGNDLACHFIPPKEIWIDGQVSCEETEFSIETELAERELMVKGKSYDEAYEQAIHVTQKKRVDALLQSRRMPPVEVPAKLDRDIGTGDEK